MTLLRVFEPIMNDLTVEQFQRVMPAAVRGGISTEVVDNINTLMTDPDEREHYRDNLLSYSSVMAEGKFKLSSYIDAVRYVSYKLQGSNNIEAYTKTFPARYQKMMTNKLEQKDIASTIASYNRNKLVNLIWEQTLAPTYILNADIYQKAINTQADLMIHAKSEKVRSDAANSILNHLKRPETQKVELDVGVKDDGTIAALRAATMELVGEQRAALKAGTVSAQEVAHSTVIEGECEEID